MEDYPWKSSNEYLTHEKKAQRVRFCGMLKMGSILCRTRILHENNGVLRDIRLPAFLIHRTHRITHRTVFTFNTLDLRE